MHTSEQSRSHCFITYENRERAFHGIQLLIVSMSQYAKKNPRLYLYSKSDSTPKWFLSWLEKTELNIEVELKELPPGKLAGWNLKPQLLEETFAMGYSRVTWLDSDLIINQPFESYFDNPDLTQITLASEPGTPDPRRTTFFDATFAQAPPLSPNTCIIQMSRSHLPLIETWHQHLKNEKYLEIQSLDYAKRPEYMRSDQDVLAGILASSFAVENNFSNIRFVDYRNEILHSASFGMRGVFLRWRGIRDRFVHSQGIKPWDLKTDTRRPVDLYVELSPYMQLAQRHKKHIQCEAPLDWLNRDSEEERWCRRLALNHSTFRLLPHIITVKRKR